MSSTIAVFGAGPGLGQAVAHRYAKEGWQVVVVARHAGHLDALAKDITAGGGTAHALAADLSEPDAIPVLAERIRATVGDLDAFYYGACAGGFSSALDLTPEKFQAFVPLSMTALIGLVHEFLPAMLDRGDGAILNAQGASATRGIPNLSGPGPALAAQRNYLQSLQGEVADRGVYIGRLYIGAAIIGSAWHAEQEAKRAAGEHSYRGPTVDPALLADQLWTMHSTRSESEASYPERAIEAA
jgi:short-subunit dehydrogenase